MNQVAQRKSHDKMNSRLRKQPWISTIELSNGIRLHAPKDSLIAVLLYEVFLKEEYRPDHRFSIRRGDTVIDIGANIGVFTVWASKQNSPGRIFSVEPVRANVSVLRKNILSNKLENVKVLRLAVTGKNTRFLDIFLNVQGGAHTSLKPKDIGLSESEFLGRKERVPAISLDALFKKLRIERCDFLKIDCEGGEYGILKDASSETMKKIRRIAMEYHSAGRGESVNTLRRQLQSHGFAVAIRPYVRSRKEMGPVRGMLYALAQEELR